MATCMGVFKTKVAFVYSQTIDCCYKDPPKKGFLGLEHFIWQNVLHVSICMLCRSRSVAWEDLLVGASENPLAWCWQQIGVSSRHQRNTLNPKP